MFERVTSATLRRILAVGLVSFFMMPSVAWTTTITVRIGADDGFGGTQGADSDPGDGYVTFSSPAIAPGNYVDVAGLDKATAAPWTPYRFFFDFPYDLGAIDTITFATVAVQAGSIGRRTNGTGFGFAAVTTTDVGTMTSAANGNFLTISTGASGSATEEQVRLLTFDVTALVTSLDPDATGTLRLAIDGSLLAGPVDQFALDFAELTIGNPDPTPSATATPTATPTATETPTPTPTTTPSTTPTPGVCGDATQDPGEQCDDGNVVADDGCSATCTLEPCVAAPVPGCLVATEAQFQASEKTAGKEKLKLQWKKIATATTQGDFGNPASGTTRVAICLYSNGGTLIRGYVVDRAGQPCGTKPCWSAKGTKGYAYKDKTAASDGINKMAFSAGPAGKGKADAAGANNAAKGQTALPTGVVAALLGNSNPTIQLVTSDGACISATMTEVTKATGVEYKARKK